MPERLFKRVDEETQPANDSSGTPVVFGYAGHPIFRKLGLPAGRNGFSRGPMPLASVVSIAVGGEHRFVVGQINSRIGGAEIDQVLRPAAEIAVKVTPSTSMPRLRYKVANTSAKRTGRSLAYSPSRFVKTITQGAELNEAKKVLATEASALAHGRDAAEKAHAAAGAAFGRSDYADMPTVDMDWSGGQGWTERKNEAILKDLALRRPLDAKEKFLKAP